ncbi:hypothetical protein F2Q70_00013666 [Brassica cretica]|uniref:Uncharacterized protein n=1 Tax=Brassica cretica TaxID=69181 RepID=A0A8S9M7H8_BRACR|nr:hypothetical protein F2Q70_00013666 [Brassica cretica]
MTSAVALAASLFLGFPLFLTTAPDLPRSLALPFVDSVPTPTAPPLMRSKSAAMSQRVAHSVQGLSNPPTLECSFNLGRITLSPTMFLVWQSAAECSLLNELVPHICEPRHDTVISELTFSAGSQFAFLKVDSQEHHFTASASPRHSNPFPEPLVLNRHMLWFEPKPFMELKLADCYKLEPSFVLRSIMSVHDPSSRLSAKGPSYLFVSVKFKTFIFSVSVEIHLVFSESFDVGARVVHARSTSFQTLPFGLINVDSGTQQDSFISFVISCFSVMYYDVNQIVEDPSGY